MNKTEICDMFKQPLAIGDIVAFPNSYGQDIKLGKISQITSRKKIKISYTNRNNSKRIIEPKFVIKLDTNNPFIFLHIFENVLLKDGI